METESVSRLTGAMDATRAAIARMADAASATRARGAMGPGVRACQLYFVAVLLGALGYAFITAPVDFAYDFSLVHGFVVVALCSICIWLFQKRAVETRTFALATIVACVALSVPDMFMFGAFDVVAARLGAVTTAAILSVQYALAAAGACCRPCC